MVYFDSLLHRKKKLTGSPYVDKANHLSTFSVYCIRTFNICIVSYIAPSSRQCNNFAAVQAIAKPGCGGQKPIPCEVFANPNISRVELEKFST